MTGRPLAFLVRLGGLASGVAVTVVVSHVMATRVQGGIPPPWLFGAAITAIASYLLVRRVRSARWGAWARSTAFTTALLLTGYSLIGWEGHAGGYWEASRMFGHLMNVAEAVPAGDPSPEELIRAVDDFHARTADTFRADASLTRTDTGWALVITHPESGRVCALYRGSSVSWPADREGRPTCRLPFSWVLFTAAGLVFGAGAVPSLADRRTATESTGRIGRPTPPPDPSVQPHVQHDHGDSEPDLDLPGES